LPLESKLYIVGIGPGRRDHLTWQAENVINKSDFVVGYKAYLNLIPDLLRGKQVVSTGMGGEVDRAKAAVNLLEEGSVAFVSSGDPNVYGMAGLGLEIASEKVGLDRVKVVPGATSFTAAACQAGITFRESVAIISLSDLLNPWNEIERRIETATKMDMPLAIYNPKSKRRNWQLKRVLDICILNGKSDRNLLIAKNVSRNGEELHWTTVKKMLEDEDLIDKVDMFTLIIIGGKGMERGLPSSSSNINLIGMGPGNPDYLTLEARKFISKSDHIFGSERYLKGIRELAKGKITTHQGEYRDRLQISLEQAKAASKKKEISSILVGGDSSILSASWRILKEGCKVHVVPGLSSFSAVASNLGAPLVNDFVIISGTRENLPQKIGQLVEYGFAVVVYNLDSRHIPLLGEQIDHLERPCALTQDVTRKEEKIAISNASDLSQLRFDEHRCTLVISGPNSYIKDNKIITQRGYQSKYNY